MDYFLIWVFPALLLGGLGSLLLLATIKHINRCKAVAGWVKTKGTVDRALVVEHKTQRFNRTMRRGYKSSYFEPKIEYSYLVMGLNYHSTGYQNFNGIYRDTSEEKAADIVASYPPGKSVTVTFDPDNPADAYLIPETDTSRLSERRLIQIILIVIAVVWFGFGSAINLLEQFRTQNARKQLQQSAGLLPISSEQFNNQLELLISDYGLTCSEDAYAGKTMHYSQKTCSSGEVTDLTTVEIYSRKDDTQKIDFISAICTPLEVDAVQKYYDSVSALVFDDGSAGTLSDWLAVSLPEVISTGSTISTTIEAIPVTLSDLGQNIRLNLGEIQ